MAPASSPRRLAASFYHVPVWGVPEDSLDQRGEVGGKDDVVFEDEGGGGVGAGEKGFDGEDMAHVAAPLAGDGVFAVATAVAGVVKIGPGEVAELFSVDGRDAGKGDAAAVELGGGMGEPVRRAVQVDQINGKLRREIAHGTRRHARDYGAVGKNSTLAVSSGVRNRSGASMPTLIWSVPFWRLASGEISATRPA